MEYKNILGEFINDLQLILSFHIPEIDSDIINEIKADADEALTKILQKCRTIK